ncbi:PCNA-interacting partner [Xenopus laevis]|uniref:PCNA-interacting partner n=4 Tax=Xenopus laevis TaxID=8355 RepID=PARI_XENLA|nr:PCNA-interacting partner [Xenopus laevis]Q32N66.1 RecName: Full=PCNA-interacting partner; Short=PARI; AltName: Full=PARP-1 binding protein; AltName: Full=PARP1-binding protein; Short=PARPBP [Xenopus laevis]AAI08808.1 MGC132179 protein [Xenopus laevis]
MDCPHQDVLHLIKYFRKEWPVVSDSERTTICGADNMLLTLQLALAEVNKQNGKEFSVSLSDVLLTWKYLVKHKLGLACEDTVVPKDYADIQKTYDLFLKNSNSLDLIDIYEKISTAGSSEAHFLSSEQLLDFLTNDVCLSEGTDFPIVSTPCKNNLDTVKVKPTLKRIFLAYLNLLVNAKNDFALAQVLNCPERGLGREAFTDLKHTSRLKNMSIFLVATSFIRTIELGGKGYAPSESDPLRKHLKGLSLFVHFIDRLNEIFGETHDPRTAGELLLSTIKMHLIKGRGSGDPLSEAATEVAQDLDLRIKYLINLVSEDKSSGTTGISPVRPKIRAINRGTASGGRETIKTLLKLLDEEAANPPSKNKADLLCADEENTLFGAFSLFTLFRSPEQTGSSPKALSQRVQKAINKDKPKLKHNLIRSQFACTYKDSNLTQTKQWDFPSMSQVPSCIHPAPKIVPVLCFDEEPLENDLQKGLKQSSGNIDLKTAEQVKNKPCKNVGNKRSKRKQVDIQSETTNGQENEPPQKKAVVELTSSKANKQGVSRNKASKNKLITGQAKLTSFFRV